MPLWLRLLIRRLRSPEGKLAPLAVISIAVSVTLATGLEMASRSAQQHLDATAEAMTGSAKIEVAAGGVGVPEELLEVVRGTPGVRAASPLVSTKVRLIEHDLALNLIGVDLVAEEEVRSTAIEDHGLLVRDPLRLLVVPNSIVATEGLLSSLGLLSGYREGVQQTLRVRANGSETTLVVQGVLRSTGIAAAFGGQVALMDVYSAQALAGRVGLFDRIDVVPHDGQHVAHLIADIDARLGGVATVQPASARSRSAEDLLAMVRRSALLLAAVASVVASLMTYATTAQWVERQKRQIATLRAVGMEASRVRRMIFSEVTALAILGTLLGVVGGISISPPLLATLSKFLEVAQVEHVANITLHPSTLWVAAVVGLVAGAAGSVLPAFRASRRFTLDSLDLDQGSTSRANVGLWLGTGVLALFAIAVSIGPGASAASSMFRLGVLYLLGPLAILALSPSLLRLLHSIARAATNFWPALGHLVTRFYGARPWTFAVAVTAISALVGALVTVFLLVATIREAADGWMKSRYPPSSVLISPNPIGPTIFNDVISRDTLAVIGGTPGVIALNERYRGIPSVLFRGQRVRLNAQSMEVMARYGDLSDIRRRSSDLARDLQRDAIAVSTGLSKTFSIKVGDNIDLGTTAGRRSFPVVGIFEDFGDAAGSILLDINTYDRHWRRPGASSALIWCEGPSGPVLEEIRRRVGSRQDLFFADSDELAALTARQVNVFTATLHVLGAFISSLGAISVLILLAGIVTERRHDLATLRAVGAEPRQLVSVILVDATALGLLGSLLGLALGLASATSATDILRESYGWILEQCWTAPEIPAITLGGVVAAVLGSLIPARLAFRTSGDFAVGPE